jgi:hypothetical protein
MKKNVSRVSKEFSSPLPSTAHHGHFPFGAHRRGEEEEAPFQCSDGLEECFDFDLHLVIHGMYFKFLSLALLLLIYSLP